jgi:c-di-GMP-binding flagellar brake protein YcgR
MTEERRRSPRYEISTGELAVLPVAISVQILDISPAGVLLQSTHSTTVGSRGRLTMTMDGLPFSAEVEVRRISLGMSNVGHRIGVMFVDLNPECQQMIERFTQQRPA